MNDPTTWALRPLSEGAMAVCDWGDCDDLSIRERFSWDLDNWLPVCAAHALTIQTVELDRNQQGLW